jgi:hypothetical protein
MSYNYKCKVCGEEYETEKGLHIHLKKHKIDLATYYTTYYPRNNLLTGEPLPFKNKEDYFNQDFTTRRQMLKWCANESEDKVGEYIIKKLKDRIEKKKLQYAPNHLELKIAQLPDIDTYKRIFGSYSKACKKAEVKPLFSKPITPKFFNDDSEFEDLEIMIDTREQKPLVFNNSQELKLDFGDYTVAGEDYNYTYIDRKAEQDFKGTMSGGFERFKRELDRVKQFESYLFIVVESDLNKIYKNNMFGPHKSNLKFVYHNMRLLTHEYKGYCQFVFTGNRTNSQSIIPKILTLGKSLWDVDLQYYIDRGEV